MEVRLKLAIKVGLILPILSLFITTITLGNGDRAPVAVEAPGTAQRSGAAVYAQTCARCHGSDGRAGTAKGRAVGATDLTSADWVPDAARDTRIVTRGKEAMPAFKGKLKPAEIEAVVSYIRRFKR